MQATIRKRQLQMLLFPNALCCSLYERNCVCAVTKISTKFLPANNFCQLLRVTRKRSCTSAGNAQAQLHFRDDQQRAFGISNISNCALPPKPRFNFKMAATWMEFSLAGFVTQTIQLLRDWLCKWAAIWFKLLYLILRMDVTMWHHRVSLQAIKRFISALL